MIIILLHPLKQPAVSEDAWSVVTSVGTRLIEFSSSKDEAIRVSYFCRIHAYIYIYICVGVCVCVCKCVCKCVCMCNCMCISICIYFNTKKTSKINIFIIKFMYNAMFQN